MKRNTVKNRSVLILLICCFVLCMAFPVFCDTMNSGKDDLPADDAGYQDNGWQYKDDSWYYYDADGSMKTGWLLDDESWYYMDEDGIMQTGWLLDNGCWYYLDDNGKMHTGWLYCWGKWFYLEQSGVMLDGWQSIDDNWYYFLPEQGAMAVDCWVTDQYGRAVYVNSQGAYTPGNLTWIGDSLSTIYNCRQALYTYFLDPDIYSQISKSICSDYAGNPCGLTIARYLANAGMVQDYLVFQLGTNLDILYPNITMTQKINELINIVGSDTKIILVTAYMKNNTYTYYNYGMSNYEMRVLAAENPNIAVADWAAVCNPLTDLSDSAHPSNYGGYKLMCLIRDTLISNFGPQ